MTISSLSTIQAYQLKAGGTRARLAILRMIAANSANNANPATRFGPNDWKRARRHTFGTYEGAYIARPFQGSNDGEPVWYCHSEYFRNETEAHEILNSRHMGYYTNSERSERAVGVIAHLTHGRYIAGYMWTSNDERVWFPEVFTEIEDAARMADSHAESFAKSAREDDEHYQRVVMAEIAVEEQLTEVQESIALRRIAKFGGRDRVRAQIKKLRELREELTQANREYEGA